MFQRNPENIIIDETRLTLTDCPASLGLIKTSFTAIKQARSGGDLYLTSVSSVSSASTPQPSSDNRDNATSTRETIEVMGAVIDGRNIAPKIDHLGPLLHGRARRRGTAISGKLPSPSVSGR